MSTYAFETGRFESDNGCEALLRNVSLDFHQQLLTQPCGGLVKVALGDGHLKITGVAQSIKLQKGEMAGFGQIYFLTTISNFGAAKSVTIRLNRCRMTGNSFEALPDEHGNVFTLSMEDASA